jgi:hypothetical protein
MCPAFGARPRSPSLDLSTICSGCRTCFRFRLKGAARTRADGCARSVEKKHKSRRRVAVVLALTRELNDGRARA